MKLTASVGEQHWRKRRLLLPLLLSHVSRVRLCATPQTAAHQAPLSLGFSRQEHWSGLPFPSPMQESEKWKWSCSVVSDSSWPRGLQLTRLLCPWDFPGKSTGVGCHCLLRRERRLVTSFSGKLTGFLTSPYPHSMIYGVFSSTKVEFYSFIGNYFDTHNSFNSRIRSFHKLLHSHFINSLPDKDPL